MFSLCAFYRQQNSDAKNRKPIKNNAIRLYYYCDKCVQFIEIIH